MAGAYAALVSLMHTIDQIQNHPRPPISLDKEQVESFTERIAFLQEFLEAYNSRASSKKADSLRSRIKDAAYAAEDIVESHVVDQLLASCSKSTHLDGEKIGPVDLYQGLQKVIQDMDLIKKEVMEDKRYEYAILDHRSKILMTAAPSRSPATRQEIMVGIDYIFKKAMDMLTQDQPSLQVISIVGMPGIGKTTFARHIYETRDIVETFVVRAWVTMSEEYMNAKELLLKVLLCQKDQGWSRKSLSEKSEEKLGAMLEKSLSHRRYLIILDNMWSTEAWDKVKSYFPNNNNGSRVIITTRLEDVAFYLAGEHSLRMPCLTPEESWELLQMFVFQEYHCPPEIENIGKRLVYNCGGVPLSIVAIGRLLAKSNLARESWLHIDEILSAASINRNGSWLEVLHICYDLLPVHLKPCFLYMGIFPNDNEIRVSQLIKLWVAEGFLKPIIGKSLEVVAGEYLKDLIDRGLVLVHKWGSSHRKIKSCSIHDHFKDVCLTEALKEKFFLNQDSLKFPEGISTQRFVAIHTRENFAELCHALQLTAPTRSLIFDLHEVLPSIGFRLLRVLKATDRCSYDGEERHILDAIFQLVNLRYLNIVNGWNRISTNLFPSSVDLFWNLQTLIVKDQKEKVEAPPEFWKMPQLRHVEFNELYLPNPSSDHMDERDDFVLGNLQTLLKIVNFTFSDEVVKRIPNVKKLQLSYEEFEEGFDVASYYCLNNLGRLQKLKSLACFFFDGPCRSDLLHNLTFPHSLKELTLYGTELCWEDMSTMIGSLPHLEVLRLKHGSFIGREWETVEGRFCSLRVLIIDYCDGLRHWLMKSHHFPCLERLVLRYLYRLKEIPLDIGLIDALQLIQLEFCSDSAVISAKCILEHVEELGDDLQVKVLLLEENRELQSLARPNFQVRVLSED